MELIAYPELLPGICFICEGVPPETVFVDTARTFEPSGYTHLNGRKYICASCVIDAANALNIPQDAAAVAEAKQAEAEERLLQVTIRLADYEQLDTVIKALTAEPPKIEDKVKVAEKAITSRKKNESASADAAQAVLKRDKDAEEEGARLQAEIDKANEEHVVRVQESEAERIQAEAEAYANGEGPEPVDPFGLSVPTIEADPGPPLNEES